MKPIKVLELSEVDRLKLEKGYHNGPTHSFRIRCKSILLKSEGKSAPQIAEMLEVTVPTVYAWVKRYEENGIKGLETRPGQGRKPIMDCSDEEAVRMAIEEDRQSVSKAREAWQNATGKETSDITIMRPPLVSHKSGLAVVLQLNCACVPSTVIRPITGTVPSFFTTCLLR